jgi:hypothetical protein
MLKKLAKIGQNTLPIRLIMLKSDFETAHDQIRDFLSAKDPQTGQTWFEFCRARGFTMSEMFAGFERQQEHNQQAQTIDHEATRSARPLPPLAARSFGYGSR